jgi:phage/plasmid-associated DNA primase
VVARFLGKTLLTGKDVAGRFLEERGAHVLKALVGHDLLSAERKGSNADFQVRGDFAVVITCNSRLRVKLDGDADAWRRRLLIVPYERPKPERPEREFATRLLVEEGPGILRWMVDGARAHLADLADCGDYKLTARQQRRVDTLLAESDSVREFVRCRVEACTGADVTVSELLEAYSSYCDLKGWEALPVRRVEKALPDAMQELRRAARRHGIERGGTARRGFANVRLIPAAEEPGVL